MFYMGDMFEEVARKAPAALESNIGAYLASGDELPSATFGHKAGNDCVLAIVAFDASTASVGAPCVMASTRPKPKVIKLSLFWQPRKRDGVNLCPHLPRPRFYGRLQAAKFTRALLECSAIRKQKGICPAIGVLRSLL
jgi:hypothetical protein